MNEQKLRDYIEEEIWSAAICLGLFLGKGRYNLWEQQKYNGFKSDNIIIEGAAENIIKKLKEEK